MKAKLYILGDQMEIRLSNDELLVPAKNETKEQLIQRAKEIVNIQHLDDVFELIEIDKEMVATNDDATLAQALKTAEGLQKQLIELVISERGTTAKKEKKEKVAAVSVEDAKASAHYKESEANIGKFASFSPFKSEEVFQGKIAGVALNKTNTIVYYTIVEADGKRRCCAVKNESVKFIEPIARFQDKKPAAKAEKAEKVAKTPEAKKGIIQEAKPVKKGAAAVKPKAAVEEFGADNPGNSLM